MSNDMDHPLGLKLVLTLLPYFLWDDRLRTVLSVVGPDALKKSRRDEERAKRAHEEVNTHLNMHIMCVSSEQNL